MSQWFVFEEACPGGKRKELLNFTPFVNQPAFVVFSEASICVPFVFRGLEFGFKRGECFTTHEEDPPGHTLGKRSNEGHEPLAERGIFYCNKAQPQHELGSPRGVLGGVSTGPCYHALSTWPC